MTDFPAVFEQLRAILQPFAPRLLQAGASETAYYLNTDKHHNKVPICFGGVEIKKNYVSYHLFPAYMHRELLGDISPELRKRMQGKSCFNFAKVDPQLFAELGRLTATGFAKFEETGLV